MGFSTVGKGQRSHPWLFPTPPQAQAFGVGTNPSSPSPGKEEPIRAGHLKYLLIFSLEKKTFESPRCCWQKAFGQTGELLFEKAAGRHWGAPAPSSLELPSVGTPAQGSP